VAWEACILAGSTRYFGLLQVQRGSNLRAFADAGVLAHGFLAIRAVNPDGVAM